MADPSAYTYEDPLKGYENAAPLPDELQEDGKSFKNPPRADGGTSKAYTEFTSGITNDRRGGFDIHIYYYQDNPEQREFARALWKRIRYEFPELRIYRFWEKPIGPHPVAMFEVNVFTPAQFGAFIPWLVINRGPLSALVHPNCEDGDGLRDHTQRATWLGDRIPLDLGPLRKFEENAKVKKAKKDEQNNSSTKADEVYLVPRKRRPSLVEFIEAAEQHRILPPSHAHFSDSSRFDVDFEPEDGLDYHVTQPVMDTDLVSAAENFDRAESIAQQTFLDVQSSSGRNLHKIEAPGQGDSDANREACLSEKESLDSEILPEALSKTARGRDSQQSRSSKWSADGIGPMPWRDGLRDRTLIQLVPYSHERKAHAMKVKEGKEIDCSEVDAEVMKSTQNAPESKSQSPAEGRKRAATSTSTSRESKSRKTSPDSTTSVKLGSTPDSLTTCETQAPDKKLKYAPEQIIKRTVLYTYLKGGNDEDAAPVPLAECNTLELLISFVDLHWGSLKQASVDSIRCRLPWKKDNKQILIREGWKHSFKVMMQEIQAAPVWEEGADKLEMKLVVTLKSAN